MVSVLESPDSGANGPPEFPEGGFVAKFSGAS